MTTDDLTTDVTATLRASLTVRQKILVAAVALCEGNFDVDALVLRAWELFPESFSLTGGKHPDSNRVLSKLSGTDGLCTIGWLTRPAPSTYRVTRDGRRLAASLTGATVVEEKPAKPTKRALTKAEKRARIVAATAAEEAPSKELTPVELLGLSTLAKCEALRKFLRGSPVNFADACDFWGVSPKRPADAVARAEHTERLLVRVVESLREDGPVDPKLPSLSTCYGLLNLHRLMRSRFAKELDATQATEVSRG
jgi:hypothetical protein